MRKLFAITLLLALSIALEAQQSDLHADTNPAAEGKIKALELKLAELIVRDDWDEYEKHLASDYLHTRDNGHVEYKDEALAGLRDVKRKVIVMEMELADLAIRIYGDTAISNAEFTIRVRENGQVKSRRSRQTDVFVKRDGQWYLIAEQGTTIGK
jgi:ketosteroid isomerase-like protein